MPFLGYDKDKNNYRIERGKQMKKESKKEQSIFVYIDYVINSVATSGIDFCDFVNGIGLLPENLLLLKHNLEDTSFNAHTLFHYLEASDIDKLQLEEDQNQSRLSWIDFDDVELLNQLTPQEIAELLYLAHTGNHLRSPFYYKLQNNFVYLSAFDGGLDKTYYRNIDRFYRLLSYCITKRTTDLTTEKSIFSFGKKRDIADIPETLVEKLVPFFKEGIYIDFANAKKSRAQIEIPLFTMLEEEVIHIEANDKGSEIGSLIYDNRRSEWNLVAE